MHSPTPVAFCAPFFTDQLISSQLPQSFRKRRRAVRLGLTPLVPVSLTLCPLVPVSLSPLAFPSLQLYLSKVAIVVALPPATYVSDPLINTILPKPSSSSTGLGSSSPIELGPCLLHQSKLKYLCLMLPNIHISCYQQSFSFCSPANT